MQVTQPKPMPGAHIWPLSVEAYHTLGEAGLMPRNTELLHGIVYTKLSKSPLHSFIVTRLLRLLQKRLPEGCLLRCEQPVSCTDSELEPDLSVVRGSEEEFLTHHPTTAELVVEVCVSSHEYDRSKLNAYASAGVKEVWLVLVPEQKVEVHRQPSQGSYAQCTMEASGSVGCETLLELSVDLDAIFTR